MQIIHECCPCSCTPTRTHVHKATTLRCDNLQRSNSVSAQSCGHAGKGWGPESLSCPSWSLQGCPDRALLEGLEKREPSWPGRETEAPQSSQFLLFLLLTSLLETEHTFFSVFFPTVYFGGFGATASQTRQMTQRDVHTHTLPHTHSPTRTLGMDCSTRTECWKSKRRGKVFCQQHGPRGCKARCPSYT